MTDRGAEKRYHDDTCLRARACDRASVRRAMRPCAHLFRLLENRSTHQEASNSLQPSHYPHVDVPRTQRDRPATTNPSSIIQFVVGIDRFSCRSCPHSRSSGQDILPCSNPTHQPLCWAVGSREPRISLAYKPSRSSDLRDASRWPRWGALAQADRLGIGFPRREGERRGLRCC